MSKLKVEVFTDFVCPWCFLNTARVERIQQNLDVDVQWLYFPLHPNTPANGLLLSDLFSGRAVDIEAVHARLKRLMDAEGLPFNTARTHTYNSRLAQELAKAYDIVRDPLYRAYFNDVKNIGNIDVLLEIAQASGIPSDSARQVLTERTFKNAVDADWKKAHEYGITGVPTFVADHRKLSGAQPYEILEGFLVECGADRKI